MFEYKISNDEWNETATPMTQKRLGHSCAMIDDNRLIVVGGIDENYNYLKSCVIFHLDQGIWAPGPDLPAEIAYAQFVKARRGYEYLGYLIGERVDDALLSSIYGLDNDLRGFKFIGNLQKISTNFVALTLKDKISEKCVEQQLNNS